MNEISASAIGWSLLIFFIGYSIVMFWMHKKYKEAVKKMNDDYPKAYKVTEDSHPMPFKISEEVDRLLEMEE